MEVSVWRKLQDYFNRTKNQKSYEEDDEAADEIFQRLMPFFNLYSYKLNPHMKNQNEAIRQHFLKQWEKKREQGNLKWKTPLKEQKRNVITALHLHPETKR